MFTQKLGRVLLHHSYIVWFFPQRKPLYFVLCYEIFLFLNQNIDFRTDLCYNVFCYELFSRMNIHSILRFYRSKRFKGGLLQGKILCSAEWQRLS